jgi:hypothetical protein
LQECELRSGEVMAEQSNQHPQPTRQAFQRFQKTLDTRGVRAALAYIVSRSMCKAAMALSSRNWKTLIKR